MKGIHFLGKLFVQHTPSKREMSLFGYVDEFVLALRWQALRVFLGECS